MKAIGSRLAALYGRLGRHKDIITHYPFIENVNGLPESGHARRALLLYITDAFVLKDDAPRWSRHQNLRQCKLLARVLGELGYIVDAGNGRDTALRPRHAYDLILTDQADRAFATIRLKEGAKRVFIATSMNFTTHNRNVRGRHERLSDRRRCNLKMRRMYPETMAFARQADAIVGVGNEASLSTWREVCEGPIYAYNNTGWKDTVLQTAAKDFALARRGFLFFGSSNQVQKGLDLLLEIFARHPELHLYVCGDFLNESDFCICYRKELFETANIHPIGWTTVNSPEFYRLARDCAYVIHPSCSEGQAGAVVQCMHAGLIPLVTREAGVDVADCGVTFADDSIEEIERVVGQVAARPETWHRDQSFRTRALAERDYSEQPVGNRMREILTDLLHRGGSAPRACGRETARR